VHVWVGYTGTDRGSRRSYRQQITIGSEECVPLGDRWEMKEIRRDWNEKHLKESSFKQEMVRACTKTGHKKTA